MHKSFKREQIALLIRNSIDLYLAENIEAYGFSHIIDVNMSEDLKTAYVYIASPVEKNEKTLENNIINDNKEIVRIFKRQFSSKFIPKLKFVFIKDSNDQL